MSKKQFKSHASSGRASANFGAFGTSGFGTSQASVLSYVQEPPDYAALSDANTVVAFKNLSKKDETTKAKAVEDLQTFINSLDADIEDGFLEAWIRVFPRLSIENSRRVRQLAHVLNGQVSARSGKRVAKHMPRIAGPWLAGTFDSDRTVSRAAVDALELVFPTIEKVQGVRRAFQHSILEYCRDAALNESIKTLSDERIVSSDDAEATYARVVATSLAVVSSLLAELDPDVVQKEAPLYQEILHDWKVWDFVHYTDVSVRRTANRLVQTSLEKQPDIITENVKAISNAYVYKGLGADQTGSALDFVKTLYSLTVMFPTIWTDAYTVKKPAISRLRNFLKKGSQSTSTAYWESLSKLFRELPFGLLPQNREDIADVLAAARVGVSLKEERFNTSAAWLAYFTLADVLTNDVSDTDAETDILRDHVLPVIEQCIYPSAENAGWSITGARPASTVSRITIARKVIPLIIETWPVLSEKLVELARVSQPEQSKDFDKSQLHVATTGERLGNLQGELWEGAAGEQLAESFILASTKVLESSIVLLKSRNGKPYGAAAIIEQLLRTCGKNLMQSQSFRDIYLSFAQQDIPVLLFSPSQKHLLDGVYTASSYSEFPDIFAQLVTGIVDAAQPIEAQLSALQNMFTMRAPRDAINLAKNIPRLQAFLAQTLSSANSTMANELFANLVRLGVFSEETVDIVLSERMGIMTTSSEAETTLSAMDVFMSASQGTVQRFASMSNDNGKQLLPTLLKLEQSTNDEVAEKATALSSRLSSTLVETTSDAKYSLILQNLEQTSRASLPMDSVHELAHRLLGPEPSIEDASQLLPPIDVWLTTLRAAAKPPNVSLALMSVLGGTVYLVKEDNDSSKTTQFDAEGFSQAFRISAYVARLLASTDLLPKLGEAGPMILALLHISVQIAEDNISVLGSNDLWTSRIGSEGEAAGLEFISEARRILDKSWKAAEHRLVASASTRFSQVRQNLAKLQLSSPTLSAISYYTSLAFVETVNHAFELHGFSSENVKESEAILGDLRSTKQTPPLTEHLVAFQQPLAGTQVITKLCNELVADLTDLDINSHEQVGLEKLIVLNTLLRTQEGISSGISKQRLIFFVKRIISWLNTSKLPTIQVEICKALVALLPSMQDIYGEHWEQILTYLTECWAAQSSNLPESVSAEANVLLINATLRIYGTLKKLSASEEPNDDLVDSLKESADQIREGLIHLLTCSDGIGDDTHQPLMVTHELLARQLSHVPRKLLKEAEDLYPLIYTPSRPLIQAAFDLLHNNIPLSQEQISFDAALDNKIAHLPDELLSLILESPTLDTLADASFDRAMPVQLQGFLFSWRLLFDHFNGSSFRVKNDYIEQLKEGAYLDGLLSLVFDFLGHTRGKPVDVSKFDIQNYQADSESAPERDVQWLLTHLYYLALTHLPSSVKSYYLNIRSRQTSATIESWTAKHISPLIIEASLRSVAEWSEKSVKEDPEYEKMTVRVGMKSKEIHVSYVVDEQTMAIKVVLPDAYPLVSAQVLGVSRVAVKEEKWQSWLRNCQGVITFSNGSIIDGLTAWRKNVTGALKGQTECAICYSIISADKQLPTKRCPTCKNLFHSSCLLKWFKTSNASTCPLCRNPFQF